MYREVSSANANGDFEVGIFPHFEIDELDNSSVHLFFNSCSFSEMDEACSRKYLSVIERCFLKYFIHDNHDNVFSFRQADGSVSRNVIGSKLIPDPSTFKLIYKKSRTHSLPEDGSFKSFEHIYEKISKGEK